jgi:hypothetical protein
MLGKAMMSRQGNAPIGLTLWVGSYTKADFERSEIGDDLPVADHVR